MWWPETTEPRDEAEETCSFLRARACAEGMNEHHADELVQAVRSFCRARHGTDHLSAEYLAFLFCRAASGFVPPGGEGLVAEGPSSSLGLALSRAKDPSSLYEAHRRGLAGIRQTSLLPGGQMLQVNAGKISIRPGENLSLIWGEACNQLGRWLVEWRLGNEDLHMVKICGKAKPERDWGQVREVLEQAIRAHERRAGLPPADLIWSG